MSIHKLANYRVIETQREYVLIEDLGPHDEYLTVTNAAEYVVKELWQSGVLHFHARIFYVDSDQMVDELRYAIDGTTARFTGYSTILQEDTIGQSARKAYEDSKKI